MKIKTLLLSALVVAASCSVTAQTTDTDVKYMSPKFKDNIFISIGVGAQGYLTQDNFDHGFGKVIQPLVNLSVGKWMDPYWGLRGQASGWQSKMYTDVDRLNNGGVFNKFERKYINLNLDFMLNLTNLWRQYDPENKWDMTLFLGPGLSFGKFHDKQLDVLVNGSLGLGGKYHINKYWAIDLEARTHLMPTFFYTSKYTGSEEIAGRSYQDGLLSLSIGATYTFGGRKFTRYESGAEQMRQQLNDKINGLENELRNTQSQLEAAKIAEQVAQKELALTEAEKAEAIAAAARQDFTQYVGFTINKSAVKTEQMVVLQAVANYMAENPGVKMKVVGYADKQTGSNYFNQKLSERRAKSVYDLLVKKFGVSSDRLSYVGLGDQSQPFKVNNYNRLVMILGEK
ncbi:MULTISPECIES: OmpA family protein [Butyricimonas]|uniref:OmpA family protein n=1 Tax=Butyricimonas hominis TaxID=2763032 RepID=A0ABR7D3S2_9BACT|nr:MULTISPECIES: OmpA family protein [Butyricimonas]MBC5622474.1 OmpA family protein [Butyricimonas hominis]